jgi:hypothetical protein
MNLSEAKKIFKIWQPYFETGDKLHRLFGVIPESLLPIPKKLIEEVSNLVAEDYFKNGDLQSSKSMQEVGITFWTSHVENNEALKSIAKLFKMFEESPSLLEAKLAGLDEAYLIWQKDKIKTSKAMSINEARAIIFAWDLQLEFNEKIDALDWYLPELLLPYTKAQIMEANSKLKKNPVNLLKKRTRNLSESSMYLHRYLPTKIALAELSKVIKRTESDATVKPDSLRRLLDTQLKWLRKYNIKSDQQYTLSDAL